MIKLERGTTQRGCVPLFNLYIHLPADMDDSTTIKEKEKTRDQTAKGLEKLDEHVLSGSSGRF
jgi:hypothetical protein